MAMLQSQQDMLCQILEKQKSFEDKHKDFERKLSTLDSKVERAQSTPVSSSAELGRRKRVVNRALTVSYYFGSSYDLYILHATISCFQQNKVALIHNSSENKFNPDERLVLFLHVNRSLIITLCTYVTQLLL